MIECYGAAVHRSRVLRRSLPFLLLWFKSGPVMSAVNLISSQAYVRSHCKHCTYRDKSNCTGRSRNGNVMICTFLCKSGCGYGKHIGKKQIRNVTYMSEESKDLNTCRDTQYTQQEDRVVLNVTDFFLVSMRSFLCFFVTSIVFEIPCALC